MARGPVSAFVVAALSVTCIPHYSEEYLQSVFSERASWTFSEVFFCPRGRIQITPRAGPPPPVEIASDPGRVAIWRNLNDDGVRYYDLLGCGHDETVKCKLGWRNSCRATSMDALRDQYAPEPVMPLEQLLRDYAMDAGATD
jgi:hypothetical protein